MPKSRKNEARWDEHLQRWQIKVQRNGVRKPFYSPLPGRKGKAEAERKADLWLDGNSSDDPRFDSLWEDFLTEIKIVTGTANYNKHESIGRIWILPRLKNKRASAITVQDMQDCVNAAYKKGLAKKSLSNIRGSFTALSSYALRRNIALTQSSGIVIPRNAKIGERKILQPNDINTLFTTDYIIHYKREKRCHYINAWRFAVVTGMRPGEIYGLQWDDIEGDIVHIRRSRNAEGETTRGKNRNANRWFLLPAAAKSLLAAQQQKLKSLGIISPWVFPDEHGQQTEQPHAKRLWDAYRRQHNLSSSPYEMRHTMISVVGADLPEKLLKSIVGHSASMDTLGVYGHTVDGEMVRARDIIDSVFDRLLPKP